MAKRTKPLFYVRKFINRPGHHTVASVLAQVGRGGDVTFIISDCDRTIKLDFSSYGTEQRKNSLFKTQTLIDILTQFKAALEQHYTTYPVDERDY